MINVQQRRAVLLRKKSTRASIVRLLKLALNATGLAVTVVCIMSLSESNLNPVTSPSVASVALVVFTIIAQIFFFTNCLTGFRISK